MKHAFMIESHTNWNQLKVLLSLLEDERSVIYVHVDRKASDFNSSFFDGAVTRGELHFVRRIPVTWGGSSQIDAEMILLSEAIKSDAEYYHLISGFDLPLHGMDYFDAFFEEQRGKEFLHFTECGSTMKPRTLDRIDIYHPWQNKLGKHCRNVERMLYVTQSALGVHRLRGSRLVFGKGANWFSVTKDFAKYVCEVWPNYRTMFSSSFCADEMFLHTILLNSPFAENLYDKYFDDDYGAVMRLIEWSDGDLKTLTMDDLPELERSPMLFARKFDERVDADVIQELAHRVQSER